MERVAAACTTGCYRKPAPGTTKHTSPAGAPTRASTRAFSGRHWVANWALRSVRRARSAKRAIASGLITKQEVSMGPWKFQ
jgi:hypothetical protein